MYYYNLILVLPLVQRLISVASTSYIHAICLVTERERDMCEWMGQQLWGIAKLTSGSLKSPNFHVTNKPRALGGWAGVEVNMKADTKTQAHVCHSMGIFSLYSSTSIDWVYTTYCTANEIGFPCPHILSDTLFPKYQTPLDKILEYI